VGHRAWRTSPFVFFLVLFRQRGNQRVVGKTIAVTGRGGTGKTAFTALAARYLDAPPLLIDADPDQSLASMLGVDLRDSGVKTISDILYELQDGSRFKELQSMPMPERIEYLLHLSCLYESDAFDLLTLGFKWTRGCYCHPNDILRSLVPELARNYTYTVVDSPAGLEHINRRIMASIDEVFVIMDPSIKALRNLERLTEIAAQIGIAIGRAYLVAGHQVPEGMEERLRHVEGARYVGKVAHDTALMEYDWAGRSLLELPDDSPACSSVRAILERTG